MEITPKPVPKQTVCSVCGLDWEKHERNAKPEGCVKLLKDELARRPVWNNSWTGSVSLPSIMTYTN